MPTAPSAQGPEVTRVGARGISSSTILPNVVYLPRTCIGSTTTGRQQDGSTTGRVHSRTTRLRDRSTTGSIDLLRDWSDYWIPPSLEREPNSCSQLVGVVRITARVDAIENLGGSQCRTCEQVGAFEVKRRVRREPPREPKVRLGPDVAGVALDPALLVYRRPADRACSQTGASPRVGVDLLRRPRRTGDAPHGERWRDVVRGPEGGSRGAVPVVPDEAGLVGQ